MRYGVLATRDAIQFVCSPYIQVLPLTDNYARLIVALYLIRKRSSLPRLSCHRQDKLIRGDRNIESLG